MILKNITKSNSNVAIYLPADSNLKIYISFSAMASGNKIKKKLSMNVYELIKL